jgi:hypothetical protein
LITLYRLRQPIAIDRDESHVCEFGTQSRHTLPDLPSRTRLRLRDRRADAHATIVSDWF